MIEYDYKALVNEITRRGINLFGNRNDWQRGAQALSDLGGAGRPLFHAISQQSSIYKRRENDYQFNDALRTTQKVTIATFIYMCKCAGIDTKKYIIHTDCSKPVTRLVSMKRETPVLKPAELCLIKSVYVMRSLDMWLQSNFQAALCRMHNDAKAIRDVCLKYALGVTKDGSVIFWQIDEKGNVRSGKIMQYDRNGHRDKSKDKGKTTWVHSIMKEQKALSVDWQLTQCLFGAHLLHPTYMNDEKVIGFVESEKSAVYCSLAFPQYVWVACGGFGQEKAGDKHKVLIGKKVIMFPDAHPEGVFFKKWCEIADEWRKEGIDVTVSDLLENKATAEEKAAKIDIADWIEADFRKSYVPSPIEYITEQTGQEKRLEAMMIANPNLRTLVNNLKLEIVY